MVEQPKLGLGLGLGHASTISIISLLLSSAVLAGVCNSSALLAAVVFVELKLCTHPCWGRIHSLVFQYYFATQPVTSEIPMRSKKLSDP